MPCIDFGVVGQMEQPFFDAIAKRLVAAARQVGAPDAAAEKRVAGEYPAFDFSIKADAAHGVTWRTDDFQGAPPYVDDFAVFQVAVGQVDVNIVLRFETQPCRMALGLNEIVLHVVMRRHRNAITPFHGGIADNMVDMTVRIDDHQRLEAVAVDETKEFVLLAWIGAARVDDDAFFRAVVINDVSFFTERIKDERFEFEHFQQF